MLSRGPYATVACINCQNKHKKCSGAVTCTNFAEKKLECIFINSGKKRGPNSKSKVCTDPHYPNARDNRRPSYGTQFFISSTQPHSHAQNVHLTLSEYFNNSNQELRTSQPNSYNVITQEISLSPQADLNAKYTAAINNQETMHINFIDNPSILWYNGEFPNLSNSQYNGMQLFSVDSTQDNSPAQNIHITSSEDFNTSIQDQFRMPQPNSYNAITQETIFSPQAYLNAEHTTAINNQDTVHIDLIDNMHNREFSNLSNGQFSFDPLDSDGYYFHNQYNGMQLFSIDSTQDNSPTQNIYFTSSEYFNNTN
ncbi:10601_t:CDS:1 [Cetraspora pellucida]|uniref:10601_t:CDS:1 n=1 Tax=Cetraspora pellucida TaxID=1433469 RepID=A0A9N9IQD3_9GLOM|nr:10601_t:CDS:1 [Cetraspora pellucida]